MFEIINDFFGSFVGYLIAVLFWKPIAGFPLIIIVLLVGTITFTLYFKFINIRGFRHSIDIIKGKYDNPEDTGQISHFQALTSALSATIGLGNIASVAIAVSNGGPGAVFWMMFIAVFGMTAKFVSATLGQMYRTVHADGTISGGPMYYLDIGLSQKGFGTLGKVLGVMYAIFIIGGAFGGGNMFQVNQGHEIIADKISFFETYDWAYGLILIILVGMVIVGGITRIGKVTEKIVPSMVIIYVTASLYIILTNVTKLPEVISSIFSQAFTPEAMYGGFLGVLVLGIKRAVFSNEGGVGSASIAHAAAKTDEPIREGMVAMIGPFIDTILVCFMTASVILITADNNDELKSHLTALNYKHTLEEAVDGKVEIDKNLFNQMIIDHKQNWDNKNIELENSDIPIKPYEQPDNEKLLSYFKEKADNGKKGALYTSKAFESAISWFPYILMIVVFLFSYSTMISWYYYGEKGWRYLSNSEGSIKIYQIIFLSCTFLGSIASMDNVKDFSDMMILSCAFPNIIGAMFLLPSINRKLNDYWDRYKNGKFKTYK